MNGGKIENGQSRRKQTGAEWPDLQVGVAEHRGDSWSDGLLRVNRSSAARVAVPYDFEASWAEGLFCTTLKVFFGQGTIAETSPQVATLFHPDGWDVVTVP